MNFYMLPIQSYEQLTADDIISIDDVVCRIKSVDDTFSIPSEFYIQKDKDDIDFLAMLDKHYEVNRDEMEFLMELVYQNKQNDIPYLNLMDEALNQKGYQDDYTGFVEVQEPIDNDIRCYVAHDELSLREVYRLIASAFRNYSDLYEWWSRSYPQISHTKDVFNGSSKIGEYTENYKEINICLSVLNDKGREIFSFLPEDSAINTLQALSGVKCSGKGSNETSAFKKKIRFVNENNEMTEKEISCIPHFKLDRAYSNKRIHFSWGQKDLINHQIIVVHIGEHWCEENEKTAELI